MNSFEWLQEASRKEEASRSPDACSASWSQGEREEQGALMDERLPPPWGNTGPGSATAKDPGCPLEELV